MKPLEVELKILKELVKKYGLCHPDLQVARMTEEQVAERWNQVAQKWAEAERVRHALSEPIPPGTV